MSRVPLFDHVCQGEIRHQLMSIVGRSRSKAHEGVLVHAECQVENKRLGRASGAIGVAFGNFRWFIGVDIYSFSTGADPYLCWTPNPQYIYIIICTCTYLYIICTFYTHASTEVLLCEQNSGRDKTLGVDLHKGWCP